MWYHLPRLWRKHTILEQLATELQEAKEARLTAAHNLEHWAAREQMYSERIKRLETEIVEETRSEQA